MCSTNTDHLVARNSRTLASDVAFACVMCIFLRAPGRSRTSVCASLAKGEWWSPEATKATHSSLGSRFCSTLAFSNSSMFWNVRAMPSEAICSAGSVVMSSPSYEHMISRKIYDPASAMVHADVVNPMNKH